MNCSEKHWCFSELCGRLVDKTYQLNSYLLEILTGEKLINDRNEILKTTRQRSNANYTTTDRSIEELVKEMINDNNRVLESRINELENKVEKNKIEINELRKEIVEVKEDVGEMKQDINIVKQDMIVIKTDVQSTKEKIDTVINGMDQNHSENKSEFADLKNLIMKAIKQ